MKTHRENPLLFSIKFSDDELRKMIAIAESNGESIEDCLTAFFSGCLYTFNTVKQGSEVSHELERKNGGMGRG